MKNFFSRKSGMFVLDISKLSPKANKTRLINSLYGAVYEEFRGAVNNPKYKHLTSLQKLNAVNEFAENWLKQRGLE